MIRRRRARKIARCLSALQTSVAPTALPTWNSISGQLAYPPSSRKLSRQIRPVDAPVREVAPRMNTPVSKFQGRLMGEWDMEGEEGLSAERGDA